MIPHTEFEFEAQFFTDTAGAVQVLHWEHVDPSMLK